jgi:hypothetical protein
VVQVDGGTDPYLHFEVRPGGKKSPKIDPKPLLDGWKLLEATAIYRASGKNALRPGGGSVGQILMMPKPQLQRLVLNDERIDIYECGRKDIRSGQIARPALAAMAYLAEVGLKPTITSLKCGHSYYTTSGSVSHHSSGNAFDVSRFNGQPVLGHQQRGGLTYQAIKRLMILQGKHQPTQLISLFSLGPPTLKMADHADHLHVGYKPLFGDNAKLGRQAASVLKSKQWHKLIDRLGDIDQPSVLSRPSKHSTSARRGRGD